MSEVEIINLVINKIAMVNKNVQNILLIDEVSPNRFEDDNQEENVSDWSDLIVSRENIGKLNSSIFSHYIFSYYVDVSKIHFYRRPNWSKSCF